MVDDVALDAEAVDGVPRPDRDLVVLLERGDHVVERLARRRGADALVDVAREDDGADGRVGVHPHVVVVAHADEVALTQPLVQVHLEQPHRWWRAVDALEDLPDERLAVVVVLLEAGRHGDVHLGVHLGDEERAADVPVEVVLEAVHRAEREDEAERHPLGSGGV